MPGGAQLGLQSSNGSGSCGIDNLRDPVLLVGGLGLLWCVCPWPCKQTPMPIQVNRQRKQALVTALVYLQTSGVGNVSQIYSTKWLEQQDCLGSFLQACIF